MIGGRLGVVADKFPLVVDEFGGAIGEPVVVVGFVVLAAPIYVDLVYSAVMGKGVIFHEEEEWVVFCLYVGYRLSLV